MEGGWFTPGTLVVGWMPMGGHYFSLRQLNVADQNNGFPVSSLPPRARGLGGTSFTEEHHLSDSVTPSLPYFFLGSVPFPNSFPAVHHNQAIQAKPYSLSTLRYAFHAAEDLTATTQQQPILPVLGLSHRHQVHPGGRALGQ